MSTTSAKKKMVTMKDVAAYCGVAKSTVQWVFSPNCAKISPQTIERVRAAAAELGYDPSYQDAARRLAHRKHGTRLLNRVIALFTPVITDPDGYHLRLNFGIVEKLHEQGYDILSTYMRDWRHPSPDPTGYVLPESIARGGVDGVLLITSSMDTKIAEQIRGARGFGDRPIISLLVPVSGCASVVEDDRTGAYAAMAHLLDLGHRRIGFYEDPQRTAQDYHTTQRIAGWQQACMDGGFDPTSIMLPILFDSHIDNTIRYATPFREALRRWPEMTAVLAPNDFYARQLYEILQQEGRQVPADMSVVGFDDIDVFLGWGSERFLTTVHVPLEEIGRQAAGMLVEDIEKQTTEQRAIVLPTSLIVRQTTAPPKA